VSKKTLSKELLCRVSKKTLGKEASLPSARKKTLTIHLALGKEPVSGSESA